MHTFNVALLVLAASSAAPAFAIPLLYLLAFSTVITPLICHMSTVAPPSALWMMSL